MQSMHVRITWQGGKRGNLVNGQNVVMVKNNGKITSLCSFCGEKISL